MREQLLEMKEQALDELNGVMGLANLNDFRVKYLGKKGLLTQVLRGMGALSPEERPVIGQLVNEVRDSLENMITAKQRELQREERLGKLAQEIIDVTLPGKPLAFGKKHPLTQVLDEIKSIFQGMGFTIEEGPDVESDYYNFEALNLPKEHPARDMQDSFYITGEVLLRTHTSPVQVRTFERTAPNVPLRIIAPGKVYRRDDDATHSPMFHQVEGFVVDKRVTLGDLRGTLLAFARQMFGENREIRLRPSYFPFTEPSAEVDISCMMCSGSGCRVCSHTGWLEILGSGMIHPKVLSNTGYDPEIYSGFAFGMGVERVAMLKYGIDDLRLLFDNDLRFLNQF
ncbi:MAG: phenylalanine--tRNA ligase subunit alpha [Clostridia bacterium]|nr:phenylalanine--tRNA ligase subunit alpha [Clostridia bacterium]